MTGFTHRDLAIAYMGIGLAIGLGAGYLAGSSSYGLVILGSGATLMAGVALFVSWRRG